MASNISWYHDIDKMSEYVDPTVAKACTMLLALVIVVGVLLIIPTIIQNVSMYVWDVQIKQEHNILAAPYKSEEKYLFIYRVVCYIGAFVCLCFSSLPTLMMIIARSDVITNITVSSKLYTWGWCHFFVFADLMSRSFVTYMVVIPLMEFFGLYCLNVWWRGEMRVKKLFAYITWSIPGIVAFCVLFPVFIVPVIFAKSTDSMDSGPITLCSAGALFQFYYYFEYIALHLFPCIFLVIVIPIFLRNLEGNEYGILYEPIVYLFSSFPLMVVQTIFVIYRSQGYKDILISNSTFSNSLIICLTIYHMNFSAVFLVFTVKNVVQEIREERALKRREASKKWNKRKSSQAVVQRSLRRQYSVVIPAKEAESTQKKVGTSLSPSSAEKNPGKETEFEARENYEVLFNASHNKEDC